MNELLQKNTKQLSKVPVFYAKNIFEVNMDFQDKQKECFQENYDELCDIIFSVKDKSLLKDFLNCLFTPSERFDFAQRWLIVKELKAGTPQREIAKKYNMSLCKITRGSKELQKENSAFGKIADIFFENQ